MNAIPTTPYPMYGFPEECHNFDLRHALWNEMMTNLVKALNIAFTRVEVMDSVADKFVYFFGRVILEDFMEITLIAQHGYGVAAQKLVRSMYEFTVTVNYLHHHPDEAQTFLDYHAIQQNKLLSRIIETFGESIVTPEVIADVRQKAAEVKEDFMIPVCDHDGAKMRLNHTWNRLDFISMARTTGDLGTLVIPGYFFPLQHAHPTFGGLTQRLEIMPDGTMSLKAEAQTDIADRSLMTAHNCIINMLGVQKDHFKLTELEEPIQTCIRDFFRVWAPDSPLLKE
ncbi:MAG TPA: DUF5677 domain-containing protein [Terriglobales bacterium]|jgi:hypothetical protein